MRNSVVISRLYRQLLSKVGCFLQYFGVFDCCDYRYIPCLGPTDLRLCDHILFDRTTAITLLCSIAIADSMDSVVAERGMVHRLVRGLPR